MLTVAVLHYNNDKLTDACWESVFKLNKEIPDDTEFLTIDNGSEKPYDQPYGKKVRLAQNRANIGGQNACFEHAAGDIVLFVSNDVMLHKGCLENLLLFSELHCCSGYGQIQPELYTPSGAVDNFGLRYIWPGFGLSLRKKNSICVDAIPSICYLMKKSVWKEAGGFDETLPGAYEDVDMGLRLAELSYERFVCPMAAATHAGNATLRYSSKDKWRFHAARKKVIAKHFTGLNRAARLAAVNLIGSMIGVLR